MPSRFFGETVQIYFAGETDSSLPTVFRLDDIELEVEVQAGESPTVSTLAPAIVGETYATLRMVVDPGGVGTDAWFGWDDDTNLSFDTPEIGIGSGTTSQEFSWTLFDLDCDTRYYFEAFAENVHGQDAGGQSSFRTEGCGICQRL